MSPVQEEMIKIIMDQPKDSSFDDILAELRFINIWADVEVVPVLDERVEEEITL